MCIVIFSLHVAEAGGSGPLFFQVGTLVFAVLPPTFLGAVL